MAFKSKYYDPVKAHEYYEARKKLKGRTSVAGLSEKGKAAARFVKDRIKEERKAVVENIKAKMKEQIDALRAELKSMSVEQRKARREEFKGKNSFIKRIIQKSKRSSQSRLSVKVRSRISKY